MGKKHKKYIHKTSITIISRQATLRNNIVFGEKKPEDILREWPRLKQKVPAIFVHKPIDFRRHIVELLTKSVKFYQPYDGRYHIKINCLTFKDHKITTQYLDNNQIPFHTYGYPKRRKLKVVVRGLSLDNDLKEVSDALVAASIPVTRIHHIHTHKKKPDSSQAIVLVIVPHNENGRKLLHVTKIFGKDVTLEPPLLRSKQCFRCLKWGHAQRYCHGVIKCVKCAGNHWYINCTKDINRPPKCANCGGKHVASYRKCSYCPDSVQYKNSQKKKLQEKKMAPSTAPQIVTIDNYLKLYRKKKDPTSDSRATTPGAAGTFVKELSAAAAQELLLVTTTEVTSTITTEVTSTTTTEMTPTTMTGAIPKIKPDASVAPKVKSSTEAIPKIKSDASAAPQVKPSTGVIPKIKPDASASPKGKSSAVAISKTKPDSSAAPEVKATTEAIPKIESDASATSKDEPGVVAIPKIKPDASTAFEVKTSTVAISKIKSDAAATPKDKPGALTILKIKPDDSIAPKDESSTAAISKIESDASAIPKDEPGASATPKDEPGAVAIPQIKPDDSVTPKDKSSDVTDPKIKRDTSTDSKVKPGAAGAPVDKPSAKTTQKDKPTKSPKSGKQHRKKY